MKRVLIYAIVLLSMITMSCGGNKTEHVTDIKDTAANNIKVVGDSTLYGLACEGCTDSVLIFLSFDGGDPDTFSIINAVKKHKIIGKPETGDWVGVVVNSDDKSVADMVINLDKLKGNWVYLAMPHIKASAKSAIKTDVDNSERDSIILAAMVPREQGFSLKRNSVAAPIGMTISNVINDANPVEYPSVKMYTDWKIHNGRLVLYQNDEALKQMNVDVVGERNDTVEFVFMMKDSLQLRFSDGIRNYYRK